MKKRKTFIGIIVLSALLTACSSTRYISVETYNPADITFPGNVKKVVIVNNTAVQPAEFGYQKKLYGRTTPDTIKTDSAVWDACAILGQVITEQKYFDEVLLFHDTLRKDNSFLLDQKLSPRQVKNICTETGADAIISIDRLLFNALRDISAMAEGYVIGDINVNVSGLIRTYLPFRNNSLATVPVKDSIYWGLDAGNLVMLNKLLPSGEEAVREAAKYAVAKTYTKFVPYWKTETRWFYTGSGSRWKEATVFAANEKWDEAANRWEYFFTSEKNPIKKAKAAINMALATELKGNFEEALDWANKGMVLFKKRGEGKNKKDIEMTQLYINALMERIRENKKLSTQFGEK